MTIRYAVKLPTGPLRLWASWLRSMAQKAIGLYPAHIAHFPFRFASLGHDTPLVLFLGYKSLIRKNLRPMKGFMKTLNGFLLAGFFVTGGVNLIHAQGGDNSGRFSTPAYSGTDYAQAGSGGGAGSGASGSGAAAPATGAARTAITPGSSSTAIPQQPQQGGGTALTPGAPAITPGAPAINQTPNTAIMPPTNNPAGGAVTNGIISQGTGTLGQQGNTAIGQQGTVGPGQQGVVNPGSPGRPAPNAFIVNPDGTVTALGGTAGTALGGTNAGAASSGAVSTNTPGLQSPTVQTNVIRPQSP
jgi:hypothetical protein